MRKAAYTNRVAETRTRSNINGYGRVLWVLAAAACSALSSAYADLSAAPSGRSDQEIELSEVLAGEAGRFVTTLTAEDLRVVNATNLESVLNTLPAFVAGQDRTTNLQGDRTATLDLRGLGKERTLVLINGRPFAPARGGVSVDLNALAPALIKQINVTSGGASVDYGSGAIAGVVDFVLHDTFEGVSLDVSHQLTEEGDGVITRADLTIGTAFGNQRGNIVVSLGGSDRDAVLQGFRSFSERALSDQLNDAGVLEIAESGSTAVPGTAIFSGAFGNFSDSFGVTFDQSGQVRPFLGRHSWRFFQSSAVQLLAAATNPSTGHGAGSLSGQSAH